MNKKIYIIVIVLLFSTFNLFCIEKEQLNGGWIVKQNLDRLNNNDEFFVSSIRIINIGNTSYYYLSGGLVINLEDPKPYINLNFEFRYYVEKITDIDESNVILELQDKHNPASKGKLQITVLEDQAIVFKILEGTDSFIANNRYSTVEKGYKYYLIGKVK